MIKRWALFLTLLLLFVEPLFVYCASDKQTLRYSQSTLEPFMLIHNQIPSGLVVDYLHLLETKINVKFDYRYYSEHWSVVLQKFDAREFDVIPGYIGVDAPLHDVMSKPLFHFNLVLAGRKSDILISDLEEVSKQDLLVAVVTDSSVQKHLVQNYPKIRIYLVKNIQEGLIAVEHKKVDLFIDMAPTLGYALQNSGLSNLKIVGILKDQFKLILALKDASLLPLINQGIDAISEVEKDALYKKYIKIEIKEKVNYALIVKILSIAFFAFICIGVWLAILKREIHRRKLAEEKALHANQRLQRTAEELKIAMAKTAHAHQAKSQFLANMSHEIRTPMNTIIGMTELILRKDLPEKERHYLTKVAEAGHHLLDIINDILDFSKIEANKIQLESIPFQLEELIISVSDLISMKAQQKGLEVLIDMGNITSHHYKGDPLRLKQILLNLLSNAVKFTTQGEVIIRLRAHEEKDGTHKIRFEVKDSGIGITQEQAVGLFSAFSQADMSTTRHYGGTGLGLSIAQGLVAMMDGVIHCESVYGMGSTFWFEIPLRVDSTYAMPTQTCITKALKILVVDDNETALEIFAEILHHFGVECVTCKSAKDALVLLNNGFKADVAIIDWKMEGMDGITLFHLIQEQYGDQITSIMMVTAYDKEELIAKIGTNQPYAVLVKPITVSMLFDILTDMCGHQRLIDPLHHAHENELRQSFLEGIVVLLAEDNESNQLVASEILSEVGIHVYVTQNGQEALEWLAKNPLPDLVLMDCQMPVLDGFEATRRIRKTFGLSLPIVAMTANAMKGDEQKCYDAGMDGYIAKPIDAQKLIQEIARFCHKEAPEIAHETAETLALEGINTLQAIQRLGGNAALYYQFLKRFEKEQIHFLQTYRNTVLANDLQGAKRVCHTLKGMAGTLGMDTLSALAQQAELSTHPLAPNDPLLRSIEQEIRALCQKIQPLVLLSEIPKMAITPASLTRLVVKLKCADATALDDAMMLIQSTDATLLEAFEQIKAFEFENAVALIEPMLPKPISKKAD